MTLSEEIKQKVFPALDAALKKRIEEVGLKQWQRETAERLRKYKAHQAEVIRRYNRRFGKAVHKE